MKKTYIIPETLVVDLMPKVEFMQNMSANPGDDSETEGLVKGHVADDDASAGSKNIWDEEW